MRTQLSGLIVAAITVVTPLFPTGLFGSLPEATLAVMVIAALIDLIDVPAMVDLYRVYTRRLGAACGVAARPDFIVAVPPSAAGARRRARSVRRAPAAS